MKGREHLSKEFAQPGLHLPITVLTPRSSVGSSVSESGSASCYQAVSCEDDFTHSNTISNLFHPFTGFSLRIFSSEILLAGPELDSMQLL
jgi:hypothetical protein